MIEFQHVFKSYGRGRNILADINFRVSAGEFIFVSGPSGAGKSTLLKLIGGLEPASRGSIQVNGQRLDKLPARARLSAARRRRHPAGHPSAVRPQRVRKRDAAAGRHRSGLGLGGRARALDKVGLSGKEELNPIELSGGEQQRLAIARAIVNRPAILIADEPTANLDHDNAQRIMNVFRDFNHVGVTTLIASHDQELMARYATRTLRIDPGKFSDSHGPATPAPAAGEGAQA